MALIDLTRDTTPIEPIAAHLDSLTQTERLREMYALASADQARLFEKADDSNRLDLDYFVPPSTPSGREVIHYGKNSQPALRMFQKRWCRPVDGGDRLWGYNETTVRPLIGPGYFVAEETANGGSDPRGAVVVDYFQVPDGPVPEGWPHVKPNSRGLQMFVFDKMRDYMRRVSNHVSIGVAYRKESRVMGYFVICRDENA